MRAEQANYSVSMMCKEFEVSRSGFYAPLTAVLRILIGNSLLYLKMTVLFLTAMKFIRQIFPLQIGPQPLLPKERFCRMRKKLNQLKIFSRNVWFIRYCHHETSKQKK